MYTTYQAEYDNGRVTFLDPVNFKKAKLMITVFPEEESNHMRIRPLPDQYITPEMQQESKQILSTDESLLYNI
jgi:hypothetical protein